MGLKHIFLPSDAQQSLAAIQRQVDNFIRIITASNFAAAGGFYWSIVYFIF